MTTFFAVTGIMLAVFVVLAASAGCSIPLGFRPAIAGEAKCSGFTSIAACCPAALGDRFSRFMVVPWLAGAIRTGAAPPRAELVSPAPLFEASLVLRED
jgi:hypothetical protein